ncbi:MAG: undecaprenyldiphospho-muramoylpentapeptide beta-N-acetylglucosaminyltransferase [Chitinophaga sp.]|jgi:UDP-N-acetylglucosamine--N-acetylmuramyl-(pentapeptide) pyrophosphoryl-undecaprenol N-acetylglucosamine transferase|nr:undecaprenyldiphospho-muramoylpentapeptide beta-N-acetylglucosaminyltransferase [Chitinophaga sp.]
MNNIENNKDVSGSLFRGRGGLRIIIAGGGTGGHIFPAIAIANALKQQDASIEILFVGAKGKMEMEKVPQAGYKIVGLTIAGFNRSSLIKNISLPIKLLESFIQVRSILKKFKPDAVVGVGGYSSFPVLRSAQIRGIKTFIHESNSFAGKSNMLLSRRATKIFVAGEGMEAFFKAEKIMITGNPVRQSIAHSNITRNEAMELLRLDASLKTVLVVGGSLGAKSINEAVATHLDVLEKNNIQLIWQTGKTNAAKYKALATNKKNIWISEFIERMEIAYAAADVVISRAGAMAVTELCVVKKPVVFVPFPFAAEDHQTANAMHLVKKNAALIVKDDEAKRLLIEVTIDLIHSETLQHKLQDNIAKLAITNADVVIALEIIKELSK